jgi:hypothetical protein
MIDIMIPISDKPNGFLKTEFNIGFTSDGRDFSSERPDGKIKRRILQYDDSYSIFDTDTFDTKTENVYKKCDRLSTDSTSNKNTGKSLLSDIKNQRREKRESHAIENPNSIKCIKTDVLRDELTKKFPSTVNDQDELVQLVTKKLSYSKELDRRSSILLEDPTKI